MTRKPLILAGLCVALLAAPAFAQQGSPSGAMPPPATSTMPSSPHASGTMPNTGMTTPSPTKSETAKAPHKVRHIAQAKRRSCYDLAWQSQAMNNCLARHPEQTGQTETAPNGAPIAPVGSRMQ